MVRRGFQGIFKTAFPVQEHLSIFVKIAMRSKYLFNLYAWNVCRPIQLSHSALRSFCLVCPSQACLSRVKGFFNPASNFRKRRDKSKHAHKRFVRPSIRKSPLPTMAFRRIWERHSQTASSTFLKMIPQKNIKYPLLMPLLIWALVIFLLFTARLTTNM